METLECLEHGAGSCRNSDSIEALRARAEATEAQLAAVRQALGGYPDSDLASLATTISAALSSPERELEQARDYVDFALGDANPDAPDAPLVDRIVRLVSVLAVRGVKRVTVVNHYHLHLHGSAPLDVPQVSASPRNVRPIE